MSKFRLLHWALFAMLLLAAAAVLQPIRSPQSNKEPHDALRSNAYHRQLEEEEASGSSWLFDLFRFPVCRQSGEGQYETHRLGIISFILRLLFSDDMNGTCGSRCEQLCDPQCYRSFWSPDDESSCTCSEPCSTNGVCMDEGECQCNAGYDGDGWTCCDTVAGIEFNGTDCVAICDISLPLLTNFTLSETSINTYQEDAVVTMHLEIEATHSPFADGLITATHQPNIGGPVTITQEFNVTDRTSGTVNQPVFDVPFTFPQGSPPGNYLLSLLLVDDCGNEEFLTHSDLSEIFSVPDLVVLEDITPPQLLYFEALSATTIDVSTGPAAVQFRVNVTDDLSGFDQGSLSARFEDDTGSQSTGKGFSSSGDEQEFVFSLTFEEFMRQGNYSLSLYLWDEVSNRADFDSSTLETLGYVNTIEVFSTEPDIMPPQLLDFEVLSSTTINVTAGPVDVQFRVNVTDDLSGFDQGSLSARFEDDTGSNSAGKGFSSSGDEQEFIFSLTFEEFIRQGSYSLSLYLWDEVSNRADFSSSTLENLGYVNAIEVVSATPDITPPELVNLEALSSTMIDTRYGPVDVQFRVTVTDDLSGFDQGSLSARFEDDTGSNSAGKGFSSSGDEQEFIFNVTFGQYFRDGNYTLSLYLWDEVSNRADFDYNSLASLGYPFQVMNVFG